MFKQKEFYRSLDALLGAIEDEKHPHRALARMVDRIVEAFQESIGITSGRLYLREGAEYVCVHATGQAGRNLRGIRIPASYPPLEAILRDRLVTIHEDFPGYDSELEERFQVRNYAAMALDDGRYLVSCGIRADVDEATLQFALSTIQHSLSLKLRQSAMEAVLGEAQAIQLSLLPRYPPRFEGFDIAARTAFAEAAEVGGDIHDFIDLGAESLGIAIGDASGHGLPAALQARDVVTGLRMGVEKEMKITAVMARLNKVIHASRLATRFVSLFYAELERNGNLIYVNAGHCEPVLVREGGREVERLGTGGVILGPTAAATYQRGFTRVGPGSQLLLYTDGVVERSADGLEFGEARLIQLFRDCYRRSAEETAVRILDEANRFAAGAPWQDDVTVVVVKPV
jgi:sigma-B regulation protein RsbU (phosphoserine phosphatase)